jgi:hypothetical protein
MQNLHRIRAAQGIASKRTPRGFFWELFSFLFPRGILLGRLLPPKSSLQLKRRIVSRGDQNRLAILPGLISGVYLRHHEVWLGSPFSAAPALQDTTNPLQQVLQRLDSRPTLRILPIFAMATPADH